MHDVFISYAHIDDRPSSDTENGWVTTFTEQLKNRLRWKLGREPDVFMDHLLTSNAKVTPTLEDALQSRTLVLFLSPGYLRSEWCQRELGTFLEQNQGSKNKESVFIVEIEPVERKDLHVRLQELTPLRLWGQSPLTRIPRRFGDPRPKSVEDNPYYDRLNELAHLIKAQIASGADGDGLFPSQPTYQTGGGRISDTLTRAVVWVAEPTEDLIERWYELVGAVRQAGAEIRPVAPDGYDRKTQGAFEKAVRDDLTGADLLIQLLSGVSGRRLYDSEMTYVALQTSLCRAFANQNKSVFLQWRPKELSLDQISDQLHRDLLTGAIESGFQEFRQRVIKTIEGSIAPTKPSINARRTADESTSATQSTPNTSKLPPLICVNANAQDEDLKQRVREILGDLGAEPLVAPEPEQGQSPAEFRNQLAQVIQDSEGVVIVYGRSPPAWVLAQYVNARKILAPNRSGIWGALLDGPPQKKPPHGVTSSNLMTLDCRSGLESDHLARFVDVLRRGPNA